MKFCTRPKANMRRHAYHLLCLAMSLLLTIKAWAIPPAITSNPSNTTACVAATNVKFYVSTTNATTFQWQVDNGGGFTNISNGGAYANATTQTLTINGVTATMNGYQYRCVATGPDNPPATSNAATLTVNEGITITSQPPSTLTICSNASISVGATGTITGYQWYGNSGSTWVPISNGGFYSGATTATLNITGITPGPGAYFAYYCVLTGPCVTARQSTITYATINVAPAVNTHPTDRSICDGSATTFIITASGSGATYQWQISNNNGSTWLNLSNNATYSGVTTTQLLVNVNTALNNRLYRCIVNGTCSPAATSNAARLTVISPIAITLHPPDKTICEGISTFFSVTASGIPAGYQWERFIAGTGWVTLSNTGIYSGTTTRTLTITNAAASDNNSIFRCRVTDGGCPGDKYSNTCTLTVNATTTITAQPVPVGPICNGGNASYTVSATGTNLVYQWEMHNGTTYVPVTDGGVYSGATTGTLNITGMTVGSTAQSFTYRCRVNGTCINRVSNPVMLTVNVLPTVLTSTGDVDLCTGYNAEFKITANGTGLSYQWQISNNNGSTWINLANNTTYSGATTTQLVVHSVNSTINNRLFRCVVTGACAPPAISTPARLTIKAPLTIATQPANKEICEGNYTVFVVTTTGTVGSYQWQHFVAGTGWVNLSDAGLYSGTATKILAVTGATTANNNTVYRCLVTDGSCPGGDKYSNTCTLKVNGITTITSQPPSALTMCAGDSNSISVTVSGTISGYQWYGNTPSGYVAISNGGYYSGTNTATLNIAGIMPGSGAHTAYYCVATGTCGTRKSTITYLTINSPIAITSQPTNKTVCAGTTVGFPMTATGTGLTYQWQTTDSSGWVNLANDSVYSNVTGIQMNVKASAGLNGRTYRCIISGGCGGSVMSNVVTLTVNTKPVITMHPQNANVCGINMASFSTTATGSGLMYQWQWLSGSTWIDVINDSVHYNGATTATLHISGITMAMTNTFFRCYVSGSCNPPLYTNTAYLKVSGANIIADPSSHSITANTNTTFSVTATGSGVMYQWQANTGSGWTNLSNTGNYSATTTAMLAISNVPLSYNGYQYRCIAMDSCSNDTSMAATLTVTPADTTLPSLTNYWSNTNRSNENMNSSNTGGSPQNADGNALAITGLKLYPNPNNGSFIVTGNYAADAENAEISIVNTVGQVVYTATPAIEAGSFYHKVDTDGRLAPGVYIIRITVENVPSVFQFNVAR